MQIGIHNADHWCPAHLPEGGVLYPSEMSEADYPIHCNVCHTFLENPLTSDGYAYVKEAYAYKPSTVTRLWVDFYSIVTD